MAISLKHAFSSAKADSGDATLVQPSNWNAEHTLTSDDGTLLGASGSTTVGPITVGSGLSLAGGTLTATAGASGLPLQLPIVNGRYYSAPYAAGIQSDFADTPNGKITAIPIVFSEAKTWTEIGINVSTADAGALARLGIYSDSSGTPGTLIVDAGEVDCSSSGTKVKTISQSLSANTWYWLVVIGNNDNVFLRGFDQTTAPFAGFVFGFDGSDGAAVVAKRANRAYGALPGTFPSSGLVNETVGPYIWLRVV